MNRCKITNFDSTVSIINVSHVSLTTQQGIWAVNGFQIFFQGAILYLILLKNEILFVISNTFHTLLPKLFLKRHLRIPQKCETASKLNH